MSSAIGLLDLASGALIILGIFAAFMTWAIFPILPFLLMGAVYSGVRYGVPAMYRAGAVVEDAAIQSVRWVLYPLAIWTLKRTAPVYAEGRGGRR